MEMNESTRRAGYRVLERLCRDGMDKQAGAFRQALIGALTFPAALSSTVDEGVGNIKNRFNKPNNLGALMSRHSDLIDKIRRNRETKNEALQELGPTVASMSLKHLPTTAQTIAQAKKRQKT